MKTIEYQNRKYTLLGDTQASTFLMYLVDESNPEDYKQVFQKISHQNQVCMIAVAIHDWQGELSPWSAPAIFGKHDFAGNASVLLSELESFWDWFQCERQIESDQLYLCGYSLAGLFALWASCQTNLFEKVAAVSPSVWYMSFVDYLEQHPIYTNAVYLSLGDRESNAKNKAMATVGTYFESVIKILQKQNIHLMYEYNPGNHFQDVELRINSVGCRECRPVYRKALQDYLRPYYEDLSDISKDRFEANPMRIIDSKDITDQRIAKDAPYMLDYLCDDCKAAFEALKTNLDAMGISYVVDPRIVRGLDYYTKTAFEFVTTKIGAQGTVCGGGRYDHLVEEIGGPSIPGVGFGLGKERLLILMEQNDIIVDDPNVPDISVSFIGDKARLYALDLVHKLRACGVSAIIDTLNRNLKGQMKYANKLNARYSVVIGENEIEKGIVTLKNMNSGEQKEINAIDITKEIEK